MLILAVLLVSGTYLLVEYRHKETVIKPAVVEEKIEEKNEDAASQLASAEKIADYASPGALISIYELNQRIYDLESNTIVFDTRGRTYQMYQTSYPLGHIPGAMPILHDSYCHPTYQEQIATPLQLQNLLGGYGVSNDSMIVFYGNEGLQARLYWALKMYGYDNVRILDGGLDKWKEVYDISPAKTNRRPEEFEFEITREKTGRMLATQQEVVAAIGDGNCVIVDARTKDEYLYGHISGSINFSSTDLLNRDQTFKPGSDLRSLFESNNIRPDKKVIIYSNAGVRSSLVWFALSELLGYPSVKNYDGSYNEWVRLDRPVEGLVNEIYPKKEKQQ